MRRRNQNIKFHSCKWHQPIVQHIYQYVSAVPEIEILAELAGYVIFAVGYVSSTFFVSKNLVCVVN